MTRIAIASYPSAQKSTVLGLRDVLETADSFLEEINTTTTRLQIEIVEHFEVAAQDSVDIVILPPSLGGAPEPGSCSDMTDWIVRQHEAGALICSICVGAFFLAETGLLDERPATTHWGLAEEFTARFPKIHLNTERLLIEDGDLITAGGLMAWTDLSLVLIARFLSPSIMLKTAKVFLIDPGQRKQSYYNLFLPKLTHGDVSVLKAQRWAQANLAEPIGVPDMARIAGLEPRSLHRRFRAATGHTPSDYLQRLRIQKACEWLEATPQTVDQIASQVGYLDVPSFGKLFKKLVGLSPGEYRKRFSAV